jgi:hypothetical protein
MANMEIGYYDIADGGLQHTYAIMTTNSGAKVKFPCYGGTNGDNKKFPVEFWSPDSCNSKKKGKSQQCDETIARQLTQWILLNVDPKRTNYDRVIDSSGIIYGVTGVCHQMCNTILCSTNVDNPPRAGVNWPISFDLSKLVYGFRGAVYPSLFSFASRDKLITDMIKIYQKYNKQYATDGDNISKSAISDAESEARKLEAGSEDAIIWRLENGYDKNALKELLESDFNARRGLGLDETYGHFDELSLMYQKMMNEKNKMDHELIEENVNKRVYADEIRQILQKGAARLLEIVGEEEFERILGCKPGELKTDIIEVDKVPDFSDDKYKGLVSKFRRKV